MNILIVSQFFKPETFIINDLVIEMEKLGHTVTVLTGKPNYPDGDIYPGYKISGVHREIHGSRIEVIRVPLLPRRKAGAVNLILNYLSFAFMATLLGPWLLRGKKIDAILVFAVSPITQAIPAIVIKFFKRAFLAVWVQDLWPQSLVVTGYVNNKYMLWLLEMVVNVIYRLTDLVLVSSQSFFEPVRKIYAKAKLQYYPNSFRRPSAADYQLVLPEDLNRLLTQNFCVVFAGNIGKAQGVDTVLEAAKLLTENPKIKIVFVGSGSRLDWILDQKKQFGLDNVECVGRFDIKYMPAIYSKAKLMLLTLKADEIMKYTLPWKTQSYMAAGRPIVAAIDGEAMRVVEEACCGFTGPAENARVLAENIKKAYAMPSQDLEQMGRNGLAYFEKNFEMLSQVRRLLDILQTNVSKK